jgi:hypothetical protein
MAHEYRRGKEHEFVSEGKVRVVRATEGGKPVVFITFDTAEDGADDEVTPNSALPLFGSHP